MVLHSFIHTESGCTEPFGERKKGEKKKSSPGQSHCEEGCARVRQREFNKLFHNQASICHFYVHKPPLKLMIANTLAA